MDTWNGTEPNVFTEYWMKASAHAPMRPDCPAPPLAILSLIPVALEYPPLYVAAGSSPLTPTKADVAQRRQDRKRV